jgi:hypothetical protein
MTSQTGRKLTLAKPSQKTLDDAVDRAFKAILALNPCLQPQPDPKMKRAA